MPKPKIAGPELAKFTPTRKQAEQQFFALSPDDYSPDSRLDEALGNYRDVFIRFSANDIEFCDVLSVTSPDNAVALMGAGIKNAAQAQEFLKKHRLGHLIKDYSWETGELLRRKIPAFYYAEVCAKGMRSHVPDWNVDAAEAHSIKALRGWQYRPVPVSARVRDGAIQFEDIKAVGATRMVRSDPDGNATVKALVDMANGKNSLDAAGLRKLIEHFFEDPVKSKTTSREDVYAMAKEFGADFVIDLYHVNYASGLFHELMRKRNLSDAREVIAFGDAICRYQSKLGYKMDTSYGKVISLYRGGVDTESAVDGLTAGLEVNQIIAIKEEGIAPGISSGWL